MNPETRGEENRGERVLKHPAGVPEPRAILLRASAQPQDWALGSLRLGKLADLREFPQSSTFDDLGVLEDLPIPLHECFTAHSIQLVRAWPLDWKYFVASSFGLTTGENPEAKLRYIIE